MVNKDVKTESVTDKYQDEVVTKRGKIPSFIKDAWDTFHKYGMWLLIAMALGAYIGVQQAKNFYSDKMKDVITAGAMVYKERPYQVIPK